MEAPPDLGVTHGTVNRQREPNIERDQDADGWFDAGTARTSLSLALPRVEARRGWISARRSRRGNVQGL